MKVVLAPDKFKGCLTAAQVAAALAQGVRRVHPSAELDLCPMSDGGEGFVDAVARSAGGRFLTRRVTAPLPERRVEAVFGVIEQASRRVGVIEMSAASGLALLKPDERDPEATTSFGTGELMRAAVEEGCAAILLGVGGSATIDGGIGCCQAAGLSVLLDDGEPTSLTEPLCGRDLPRVVRMKSHRGEPLAGVPITVACDVTNPLCGPRGAARAFGPQKGASAAQVEQFDQWLSGLARRCGAEGVAREPGTGAAGGLPFALRAFFGAELLPGAAVVAEAVGLRARLEGADLCITGEGRLDATTLDGKAPHFVAQCCQGKNVKCLAIAGRIDPQVALPFHRAVGIVDRAGSVEASHRQAEALIAEAVAELLRG